MRRALVTVAALATLASSASAAPLSWDAMFSGAGAPARVRLVATYRDAGGGEHRLRLWREGGQRLVRRTDDRIELHVDRAGDDYRYFVVDRARGLEYEATRTNLMRIGIFAHWGALSTLLSRPSGPYRLRAAGSARTPLGSCRRFELSRGRDRQRICWSDPWKVPLSIERRGAHGGSPLLEVVELAQDGVSDDVFTLPTGLQHIDANRDIAED